MGYIEKFFKTESNLITEKDINDFIKKKELNKISILTTQTLILILTLMNYLKMCLHLQIQKED